MPKKLRKKIEERIKGFLLHKRKKKSVDSAFFLTNQITKTCNNIKAIIDSHAII